MVGDKELDTGFRCWSCKEFTTLRARIAELEQDLAYFPSTVRSLAETVTEREAEINQLRAELAAIKAQEPVAWAGAIEYGVPLLMVEPQNWKATPLYAAPVSEAKAHGVVQWPEADEIMQMAFEEGQPADDASGYCFELEEFDLFIERLMSEVARLNAAPVQQVSVPDASTDFSQFLSAVMDAAGLVRHGRRSKELSEYLGSKCMEYIFFAAPAAPAADAELVDAP